MKVKLFLAAILPMAFFAQEAKKDSLGLVATTFSSGATKVQKFDNKSRLFNDWAISVGGGGAFMHSADLTSFYGNKINWGYTGYISLDKQISHTFGLSALYQKGKTNQRAQLPGVAGVVAGVASAYTKYDQVSIIGDLNLSNVMRRVDNNSDFRWALHAYAGAGFMAYHTQLLDNDMSRYNANPKRSPMAIDQPFNIQSFFSEVGTGVKYKINKHFDIEARAMYIFTGDDQFDGGGFNETTIPAYNRIKSSTTDNMFTTTLGLTYKLGKHASHLAWFDPLQNAYQRIDVLNSQIKDFVVCKSGDKDNDGVCDDWDRELNTPPGARVDGSGKALDMDLDGVIDLYDKCVTVPGPKENDGCPIKK